MIKSARKSPRNEVEIVAPTSRQLTMPMAVVVQLDGATGKVEAGPVSLGKVAIADAGSGPAIAAGDDGSVYVASTRSGPTWAVSKVRPADALPLVWTAGDEVKSTKAFGVALAGDRVVVVGACEVTPGTHDLKVWWVSAEDGEVLLERTFATPQKDDKDNVLDELGRGVTVVGDQIVVVGERTVWGEFNKIYRRAVVVRYSLDGELLGEWTSGGGQLEEDGAMGVAALRDGGFVIVGWGRDLFTIRPMRTARANSSSRGLARRQPPTRTPGSSPSPARSGTTRGKSSAAGPAAWS